MELTIPVNALKAFLIYFAALGILPVIAAVIDSVRWKRRAQARPRHPAATVNWAAIVMAVVATVGAVIFTWCYFYRSMPGDLVRIVDLFAIGVVPMIAHDTMRALGFAESPQKSPSRTDPRTDRKSVV